MNIPLRLLLILSLAVTACEPRSPCEIASEVRVDGDCVPYTAGEPVSAEVVVPPAGGTWQWQITGKINTGPDVDTYDVDLFDVTDDDYAQLRADGRTIVCYFSAGSYEPWKDDAHLIPEDAIGRPLDGWPDERWLDHTQTAVRDVMAARLDRAVERGCDGVEPDNVTAHHNRTGFGITPLEQLAYNRWLADEAHLRGLSVALKNDVEQVPDLIAWFDFTVNEECMAWDECDTLDPFVEAGKAVLHVEYVDDWSDAAALNAEVCGANPGFSSIVKGWDLGREFIACNP